MPAPISSILDSITSSPESVLRSVDEMPTPPVDVLSDPSVKNAATPWKGRGNGECPLRVIRVVFDFPSGLAAVRQ
jgi:hypothetical protein